MLRIPDEKRNQPRRHKRRDNGDDKCYFHHIRSARSSNLQESPAVLEIFKSTAKDEMEHAKKLGERIVYLGGIPTKKPEPIVEGGDLKKMIHDDLAKERNKYVRKRYAVS